MGTAPNINPAPYSADAAADTEGLKPATTLAVITQSGLIYTFMT